MASPSLRSCLWGLAWGLAACAPAGAAAPPPALPTLHVQGEDFVDDQGQVVRFWGVNLVACYPEPAAADRLAANLASLQVNLVRPHHNLRPSRDWNPKMASGALALYRGNSRDPDPEAWQRFDYLNAALRRQGIYLALAIQGSRLYQAGDVDVLQTDPADREAWMAAINELNGWNWRKSIDARKALVAIDERVAALEAEFATALLTHVNPYTGQAYGADSQVALLELVNEYSAEYVFVCNNVLPKYFTDKLQGRWDAWTAAHDLPACPFASPGTQAQKLGRLSFLRELDEAFFSAQTARLRQLGYRGAIVPSNLWRGDHNLEMASRLGNHVEDHAYPDPLVAGSLDDAFLGLARSQVADKPFFVGELNQTENEALREQRRPTRTMLPFAACAYGSFQGWAGLAWFAWTHGGKPVGPDGWGSAPNRAEGNIGNLTNDETMLDHLRSTGLIFRQGLLQRSREPQTVWVDEPRLFPDYQGLMRGKYTVQPGWQNRHALRKRFGPAPEAQREAAWLQPPPPAPLVADTGEIIKDVARRQLTFRAPRAEGFSGYCDAAAPRGLACLAFDRRDGFVTVIAVSLDGQPLADSRHLLLSRTSIDAENLETPVLGLRLQARPAAPGQSWRLTVTRPRGWSTLAWPLAADSAGRLVLPDADWHECELRLE